MPGKINNISRRKFMIRGIQGYSGLQLAQFTATSLLAGSGCSLPEPETKTVHGVCYHDCPDSCSWTVVVEQGEIREFGANKENPFTAGKLCGKMETFPQDITFHPHRILTPLKRVGKKGEGKFEKISWPAALKEVASKVKSTISEFGGESVLPFGYMGTQGLIQKSVMSDRFFTKLGASKIDETICGAPAVTGNLSVNGQVMGILPEDIVHSRFIILWGTNTKHSNVHLWPFVMEARNRGARIIVIDPYRSATALEADRHIQLMPGTDVALALGMMHVIINENLTDNDYIEKYTSGYVALEKHVQQYEPATVAKICGLDESLIVDFARDYAKAKPSLIRMLVGMEHNYNGGDAFRAVSMLPSLTGAWRDIGGGLLHMTYEMFGEALNWEQLMMHTRLTEKERRTFNMVRLGHLLNDLHLNPPVKTLFVYGSNPVVTIPNQNLIRKGLEREDLFTVVVEHYITDTAKYADFIFPATTQLEHWDVADSWGQIYINLNQPAIEPRGESKPNTEFFRLLAREMGFKDNCFDESDIEIAKSLFKTDHPYMKGITFNHLKKNGWARLNIPEPFLPHASGDFGTTSGKCEFYDAALEASGQALPAYKTVPREYPEQYPLQLLTVKATKGFHNSSHANVKHLMKTEGSPALDINKEDAQHRNIAEGDEVKAWNQYGSVILKARISDRVRPGMLLMSHGYWPSLVKGNATSNAMTSDLLTDLGGGAALQDCWVQVVKS